MKYFYENERQNWLYVSLSFLILTQIVYGISFAYKFKKKNKKNNIFRLVILSLIGFILGPITSIIFYCIETLSLLSKSKKNKNKKKRNKQFRYASISKNNENFESMISMWLNKKFVSHFGFVLEAFFESFGMSILQICFLLIYDELNSLIIQSLFISILSVITKSVLFSRGIEWKTCVFNWLSVLTDFLCIFFILSFIFYQTNDEIPMFNNSNIFTQFAQLYLIQLIGIIPIFLIIYLGSFFYSLYIIFTFVFENSSVYNIMIKIIILLILYAFFIIIWILSGILLFISLDFIFFSIIAFFIYFISTKRCQEYDNKKVSNLINGLISFINQSVSYRDRVLRIISVNYSYYHIHSKNKYFVYEKEQMKLYHYINKNKKKVYQLSLSHIRNECEDMGGSFKLISHIFTQYFSLFITIIRDISRDFRDKFYSSLIFDFLSLFLYILLCWIGIPLFLISKMIHFFFPYIILYFIFHNNLWESLNALQYGSLIFYSLLQIINTILLIFVCRLHFWLSHIAPGQNKIILTGKEFNSKILMKKITTFYNHRVIYEEILKQKFGEKIADLISIYAKLN